MRNQPMANEQMNRVFQHLRKLVASRADESMPDRDLLDRFVEDRDETAFAILLERHGGMVLGVSRRVLQNVHDAEDACQAVFLVLARKAASIRKRDSLGSWLHGVAFRLARNMKRDLGRRRAHESLVAKTRHADPPPDITWREIQAALDEELARLPTRFQAALVLCYLEGKTRDEAASQLGWTLGTLRGRLDRGRELLRARLMRRGLTLSATMFAYALTESSSWGAMPASLAVSTVKAAAFVSAGSIPAAGVISAKVAALSDGMVSAMFIAKLKIATVVVLLLGVLGIGVGTTVLARWTQAEESAKHQGPLPARSESAKQAERKQGRDEAAERQNKEIKTAAPKPLQPATLLDDSFQTTAKVTYPTDRVEILLWIAKGRARLKDQSGTAKAIEEALQLVGTLADDGQGRIWKSESLLSIARTQAEVDDFVGARKTIDQIADPQLVGHRYMAIAKLAEEQARTGDIKGALQTASTIRRTIQKGYALKGIATHQAEAGDIEGALATTQTIKDDSHRVEALVTIANVQFRKGELAGAKERLQEAKQIAETTKPGPTGQEATLALLEVAEALAEMGDKQGAAQITTQVLESKSLPEPTNPGQSTSYWRIARVQWKSGDLVEALRTAESIKFQGTRSLTLMEIAVAQIKAGDVVGGMKTSDMLSHERQKFDWQRFFILWQLAKAHSQNGDKEGAGKAFEQALRLVEANQDPPYPIHTILRYLKWLAKDLAFAGQEKEAMSWVERQESSDLRAAALLGLAEGLLDRNKETNRRRDE
jgi:RNA polymerase sigma factor (sigma-70 family)